MRATTIYIIDNPKELKMHIEFCNSNVVICCLEDRRAAAFHCLFGRISHVFPDLDSSFHFQQLFLSSEKYNI